MKLFHRVLHQPLRLDHAAHIGLQRQGRSTLRHNPASDSPRLLGIHMIVHYHRRAFLSQSFRDGSADAAGRTGHNGHFAIQNSHPTTHSVPWCFSDGSGLSPA